MKTTSIPRPLPPEEEGESFERSRTTTNTNIPLLLGRGGESLPAEQAASGKPLEGACAAVRRNGACENSSHVLPPSPNPFLPRRKGGTHKHTSLSSSGGEDRSGGKNEDEGTPER